MSNDESIGGTPPPRRPPRQGMGSAPAGSMLSIVLAVVAVVAGFLILRNISDDGGASSSGDLTDIGVPEATETTVPDATATTVPTVTSTTTTTIPRITEGATVVVANVNTVGGSAGAMTKTLELAGYTMGEAVNGTGPNVDASIVYYDETVAAAQDVANSVARDMGGLDVLPVPTPPPTESGTLDGAGVLVMLGNNEAGKTLEELQAAAETADADTTVGATGEAPAVSGSDNATSEATTTIADG